MPAPSSFVNQVRHALAHLYDPDVLRNHPLLGALGLTTRANPQTALRETLLDAIEALRPAASVPVASRAWRVYTVLQHRYVQQLDQEQTAAQLGVGVRHVRREQHAAIDALADLLFDRFAPAAGAMANTPDHVSSLGTELSWLKDASQDKSAIVADALQNALRVIAPLAAARTVAVEPPALGSLPPAAIHDGALRQALVSAITFAVRRAPGGAVRCTARSDGDSILIDIIAYSSGAALPAPSGDETASLQAADAIMRMANGHLVVAEERARLDVTIRVAAAGTRDILLIDDNPDFAQLFSRYLAGTRYRLHLATAASLFDDLAARRPHLIVLDVMMPGLDGWEVLGRLRQHPLTSRLPIIVCTILPERDLALALGATAFVGKPVTRQSLLEAVEKALAAASPESH